jgi:16S rRNA (cytidine1402-2'-O)-methyltransferase
MIYLIPTHLGNPDPNLLPAQLKTVLESCEVLCAENLKTARHFLKAMQVTKKIDDYEWLLLTKDSTDAELRSMLLLASTKICGVISEAGVPVVADPGASLVRLAQQKNISIVPLTGPSSVILALMASGMSGQSFCFNGYLPIERADKIKKLKALELLARRDNQAQIFIETPYRNNQLMQEILSQCAPDTLVCVAVDITLETESILTKRVSDWKNAIPELHKRPAVFIIG